MSKKIIIGADPFGVTVKDAVKKHLKERGYDVLDLGEDGKDLDYFFVGSEVGKRISSGEFEQGVIFCGTGMGVNIVANKYKGVYCGLVESVQTARLCKIINNCNVLSLSGLLNGDYKAIEMVDAWLDAEFSVGFSPAAPEALKNGLCNVKLIEDEIFG